jgi:hypothetical protein
MQLLNCLSVEYVDSFSDSFGLISGGWNIVTAANDFASTINCTQKMLALNLGAESGSPGCFFVVSFALQT